MSHHNSPTYFVYHDQQERAVTLKELIAGFESTTPSFSRYTWVRKTNSLYWSTLEYTEEILLNLHWDYVEAFNQFKTVTGLELLELFACKLIQGNTEVKLSYGPEWKKFKDTSLFQFLRTKQYPFHGIAACRPSWKNNVAHGIDICFCALVSLLLFLAIYLALSLLFLFTPSSEGFKEFFSLFILIETIFSFPSSLITAGLISRFGGTMGMKLMGLTLVTAQGDYLTFSQALSRQRSLNPLQNRSRSDRIEKQLYPYGAVKWDRDNTCLVTQANNLT